MKKLELLNTPTQKRDGKSKLCLLMKCQALKVRFKFADQFVDASIMHQFWPYFFHSVEAFSYANSSYGAQLCIECFEKLVEEQSASMRAAGESTRITRRKGYTEEEMGTPSESDEITPRIPISERRPKKRARTNKKAPIKKAPKKKAAKKKGPAKKK
jgi:hypothetical protein